MGGKVAGTRDIAPRVRGAYQRAFAALEDKGKPLSTIVMEMLEKDPHKALDTLAKFTPRELMVEGESTVNHLHKVEIEFVGPKHMEHEVLSDVIEGVDFVSSTS